MIDIEETIQMMFVGFIDDFSALHLMLLYYLNNPERWFSDRAIKNPNTMGGISSALEIAIPEFKEEKDLIVPLATDLYNKGLINTEGRMFNSMMSKSGMMAKRTTNLGERFIQYISSDK